MAINITYYIVFSGINSIDFREFDSGNKKNCTPERFQSNWYNNAKQTQGSPLWLGNRRIELKHPEEVLPEVKSVIILATHIWDRAFFLHINSRELKGYSFHKQEEEIDGYFISDEISKNKAWSIVTLLKEKGYKAMITTAIPMKTTAVKAGLGCQGKCTLLVNPEMGPMLGLMSVLTGAELEPSEPYTGDLCGDCELCIKACPTKALTPYHIKINRCLAYASENPELTSIPNDVRNMEKKLVVRPTLDSCLLCSFCLQACPIGKPQS